MLNTGKGEGDLSYLLHVLVELLPAALILQTSLGQVNWEHTGHSYHACNPSINQFGWEAV